MKVIEWIDKHPREVLTVPMDATLEEAVDHMLGEPCVRDIYVLDQEGRVMGHLSHIRLAKALLAEQRPVHTRRQLMERIFGGNVNELMDPEHYFARPEEKLDEVLNYMLAKGLEDMPVVDKDGLLIGAINLSDVMRGWRKDKWLAS